MKIIYYLQESFLEGGLFPNYVQRDNQDPHHLNQTISFISEAAALL